MKTLYVADDGTLFNTEAECIAYEKEPTKQLQQLVCDNIKLEYCENAGFAIISESNVVAFIKKTFCRNLRYSRFAKRRLDF